MMTVDEALSMVHGYNESCTLNEYYDAWQVLHDEDVALCESDQCFLEKLICDGVILTDENRDELGGQPVRGLSINVARILTGDME